MINTYSANPPPPPVPPRPGTQRPVRNTTRSHIRVLSVAFVIQTVVTIALFLYLFQKIGSASNEETTTFDNDLKVMKWLDECGDNSLDSDSLLDCKKVQEKFQRVMTKVLQPEGKVEGLSAPVIPSGMQALAQMTVEQPSRTSSNKVLQWNWDHSLLKNVDYFPRRKMLQIRTPGYYYVYSQVTFSRSDAETPLAQTVMSRRSSAGEVREDLLLKAFCSLSSSGACTSFEGGIVRLEEGQELYVNVTDLSTVNFEVTATTFGLFLLHHNS